MTTAWDFSESSQISQDEESHWNQHEAIVFCFYRTDADSRVSNKSDLKYSLTALPCGISAGACS